MGNCRINSGLRSKRRFQREPIPYICGGGKKKVAIDILYRIAQRKAEKEEGIISLNFVTLQNQAYNPLFFLLLIRTIRLQASVAASALPTATHSSRACLKNECSKTIQLSFHYHLHQFQMQPVSLVILALS